MCCAIIPLCPDDYELAAGWLSRPEVNAWLASEWRGREVRDQHVAAVAASPRNKLYMAESEGAKFGLTCLGAIDRHDLSAVLWYLRGDPGGGKMADAVAFTCREGFDAVGLLSINASVMVSNDPSRRLLERVGFRRVGVLRRAFRHPGGRVEDRELFDLLPEDLDAERWTDSRRIPL